jgi:hypothetical protein
MWREHASSFARQARLQKCCQAPRAKIFLFTEIRICRIVLPVPPLDKGRLAIAADVARNVVDGLVP